MKPGKTFKLSKPTKTMLASIVDPIKRSEWKRAMIDAELCSKIVVKPSKKERPGGNYTTTSNSATPSAE